MKIPTSEIEKRIGASYFGPEFVSEYYDITHPIFWNSVSINQAGTYRKPEQFESELFTTDSRQVENNSIFIALNGERFDGHDYVPDVIGKAKLLIVNRKSFMERLDKYICGMIEFSSELTRMLTKNYYVLFVDDTEHALGELANIVRHELPVKNVIGITGSNGKTTCRTIIETVLTKTLTTTVAGTKGNFNNFIGVPLTIFKLPANTETAVIEMGMNAPGEIRRLAQIAEPDYVVITSIAGGHMGFFDSVEAIADAKLEICEPTSSDRPRIAFLPAKNQYIDYLKQKAKTLNAELELQDFPDKDTSIQIKDNEVEYHLSETQFFVASNLRVKHQFDYLELAFQLVQLLGGNIEKNSRLDLDFAVPSGRFDIKTHPKFDWVVIDDSYNANTASMLSALENINRLYPDRQTIAILGEMGELGEFAENEHKKVGIGAKEMSIDTLYVVGTKNTPAILAGFDSAEKSQLFGSQPDLFRQLASNCELWANQKLCFIIKGSRAAALEETVSYIMNLE